VTSTERDDELHGKRAIETALRIRLVRERERDVSWVDYSSEDGSQGFEMKRVVPSKFLQLQALVDREPDFESAILSKRWTVLVDAPTNDDWLGAVPNYRDPPADEVAFWESHGFAVATAEQRREEFRESRRSRANAIPNVRGIGARLEPHLRVLEAAGITSTRGSRPGSVEHLSALREVEQVTGGWICTAREPIAAAGEVPGVDLAFGYGYARRGPDTFVQRVVNWIEDPNSKWANVVDSTANGGWAVRHGVLLFDSSDPDFWTAEDLAEVFLPSKQVPLADPIILWCVFGRVVLRQDVGGPWSVFVIDSVEADEPQH